SPRRCPSSRSGAPSCGSPPRASAAKASRNALEASTTAAPATPAPSPPRSSGRRRERRPVQARMSHLQRHQRTRELGRAVPGVSLVTRARGHRVTTGPRVRVDPDAIRAWDADGNLVYENGPIPKLELFVPGRPAPQGSKRHVGNGVMLESSKAVAAWRTTIAWHAAQAYREPPLDGA